jgi:hypothetical protein
MEGASRTRLVALAVLLTVSIPLVIVALAGGDGRDDGASPRSPAGLHVERTGGVSELTMYLEDSSLNEPATAGGAPTVVVECVDAEEQVVSSRPEAWPFADTDQGTLDPHVHIGMSPELLDRIARCRLKGTDPPLEGRLL